CFGSDRCRASGKRVHERRPADRRLGCAATGDAFRNTGSLGGTYAFAFPQLDAPGKPVPKALITVPDGWSINDGFALLGHAGSPAQLAVTIWDVVDVYANGCRWASPMIHPGATVDELAAVLAARPLRNAIAPVAVSLGGYQGK